MGIWINFPENFIRTALRACNFLIVLVKTAQVKSDQYEITLVKFKMLAVHISMKFIMCIIFLAFFLLSLYANHKHVI